MDFISFLKNNKDKEDDFGDEIVNTDETNQGDFNLLSGMKEDEFGPAPAKKESSFSVNNAQKNNFSAKGRLDDLLVSKIEKNIQEDNLEIQDIDSDKIKENKENILENDVKKETSVKSNKSFFTDILNKLKEKKQKKPRKGFLSKNESLEVNLVKDEIVQYFDWQKGILILLLSVFLAFFVLTFSYWGITWWGNKKQYEGDQFFVKDYYKINKQIKELDPQVKDIAEFQKKLDKVNFLLKRHIYWTNFFDFLEKNTLADVYFSGFAGDNSGSYKLSGKTKNFEGLDAQVKKFLENEYVTSAKINQGSIFGGDLSSNSGVSFSLDFSLDPIIFFK